MSEKKDFAQYLDKEIKKLKPGNAYGTRPNEMTDEPRTRDVVNARAQEEQVVNALDEMSALKRVMPTVLKLMKKKISLDQAIREVSPDAFMMLLKLAFSQDNPKVQSDVLRHLLALGGYNPAQKHEISRVDPNMPKEALLNLIAGAHKDLATENIEIVDDRPREDEEALDDDEIKS